MHGSGTYHEKGNTCSVEDAVSQYIATWPNDHLNLSQRLSNSIQKLVERPVWLTPLVSCIRLSHADEVRNVADRLHQIRCTKNTRLWSDPSQSACLHLSPACIINGYSEVITRASTAEKCHLKNKRPNASAVIQVEMQQATFNERAICSLWTPHQ